MAATGILHAPAEHCRIGQVRACGAGLQLREAGLMQVLAASGGADRIDPESGARTTKSLKRLLFATDLNIDAEFPSSW